MPPKQAACGISRSHIDPSEPLREAGGIDATTSLEARRVGRELQVTSRDIVPHRVVADRIHTPLPSTVYATEHHDDDGANLTAVKVIDLQDEYRPPIPWLGAVELGQLCPPNRTAFDWPPGGSAIPSPAYHSSLRSSGESACRCKRWRAGSNAETAASRA